MSKENMPLRDQPAEDENWLDYREIGKKVSYFRKVCGYSQATLAEKVDISTTHLSHIETGATKLSLPVFIKLSRALCVSTEDLLPAEATPHPIDGGGIDRKMNLIDEINGQLTGCSYSELRILCDLTASAIAALRKYGQSDINSAMPPSL